MALEGGLRNDGVLDGIGSCVHPFVTFCLFFFFNLSFNYYVYVTLMASKQLSSL